MHALKFRSVTFLFRAMKGLKKKYIKILLVVFLEKFLWGNGYLENLGSAQIVVFSFLQYKRDQEVGQSYVVSFSEKFLFRPYRPNFFV